MVAAMKSPAPLGAAVCKPVMKRGPPGRPAIATKAAMPIAPPRLARGVVHRRCQSGTVRGNGADGGGHDRGVRIPSPIPHSSSAGSSFA